MHRNISFPNSRDKHMKLIATSPSFERAASIADLAALASRIIMMPSQDFSILLRRFKLARLQYVHIPISASAICFCGSMNVK